MGSIVAQGRGPARVERLRIGTDDGLSLEAELRMPDGAPIGGAVLCHAHPLYGGSKDHPLLWAVRIALAHRGFAVLSFNFRGVMGSQGIHGGGVTEVDDVHAAIGVLARAAGPVFVCGWSFGAHVALREAVQDDRVRALALMGFPLAPVGSVLPPMPDAERLHAFTTPVLLVAGDADPYCPAPELRALGDRLGNATVRIVDGTDHYFGRREREAAEVVAAFAADHASRS
jgi:alpha/beta superfamily hydrolase